MRLSRVKIKNYRSIQECEFYPGNICAMVGENNAGKSNILRAIYSVIGRDWVSANSFSDDDFTDRNPDNDITIELEFDTPLPYQGFVAENPVDVPIVRYVVTHYKRSTKQAKAGDIPGRIDFRRSKNESKERSVAERDAKGRTDSATIERNISSRY